MEVVMAVTVAVTGAWWLSCTFALQLLSQMRPGHAGSQSRINTALQSLVCSSGGGMRSIPLRPEPTSLHSWHLRMPPPSTCCELRGSCGGSGGSWQGA